MPHEQTALGMDTDGDWHFHEIYDGWTNTGSSHRPHLHEVIEGKSETEEADGHIHALQQR